MLEAVLSELLDSALEVRLNFCYSLGKAVEEVVSMEQSIHQ